MKRRAAVVTVMSTALALSFATAASAKTAQGASRTITMTEFRFPTLPNTATPRALPSGRVRLTSAHRRAPTQLHRRGGAGQRDGGLSEFRSSTLQPGRSQTRTITLRPGIYLAVCGPCSRVVTWREACSRASASARSTTAPSSGESLWSGVSPGHRLVTRRPPGTHSLPRSTAAPRVQATGAQQQLERPVLEVGGRDLAEHERALDGAFGGGAVGDRSTAPGSTRPPR